ncbi:TIGR02391 family protein [Microbacterium maritypicum]|uniref:TIGR02391 family protein n=1 Tax=Microbacterium maritypicum TaxID=33918 RepID=UPI00381899D0
MNRLSVSHKTVLESVLGMSSGYVLDFSNATFANFFRDLSIDIYDAERYPGFGDSKANRLRALWKSGSDEEVASVLDALADYIEAKNLASSSVIDVSDDQVALVRSITLDLLPPAAPTVARFTTEATVRANKIQIEIHEDIYDHIRPYLATEDYFHAVEEAYKVVREALREKSGNERATDAFKPDNLPKIFGHAPVNGVEGDFFDGVKYLNMAIQFLRNEKSHTLATPLERNLALHYISLASLSYDLITRYVSEDLIKEIEDLVTITRGKYSATRFYRLFEGGSWIDALTLPPELASSSVQNVLKEKWLQEADFTRSYDHSNIMLMRLELVVDELSRADVDALLERPTTDDRGHNQEAGMFQFLEFVQQRNPESISALALEWMANKRRE